jgi:hypothetical protein
MVKQVIVTGRLSLNEKTRQCSRESFVEVRNQCLLIGEYPYFTAQARL